MPYIIAIVAALSVRDPLLRDVHQEELEASKDPTQSDDLHSDHDKKIMAERTAKKKRELQSTAHAMWASSESDLLVVLRAIGAFEYEGGTQDFCEKKLLHYKSMQEIRSLRHQLTNIIQSVDPSIHLEFDPKMKPPTKEQVIS